ncbi:MAG: heme-binding protein [Pedococcus sp.]
MSEPVDNLPHGVTGPGLGLAQLMCDAALRHATTLGVAVSVAVVDAGGHLVSFDRMDAAEIAGPHLAVAKAATAVAHRCASGDLAEESLPTGSLASLGSSGGGRYVVFAGGLPLWSPDGRVVAGVGVSGASADQDLDCASAAAALWPIQT